MTDKGKVLTYIDSAGITLKELREDMQAAATRSPPQPGVARLFDRVDELRGAVTAIHSALVELTRDDSKSDETLRRAALRVVAKRYGTGADSWDDLKEAIGGLCDALGFSSSDEALKAWAEQLRGIPPS